MDTTKPRRRRKLVTFEASVEWVAWVDGLAARAGTNRSTVIDQALRRHAESLRYRAKVPKR